MSFQQEQPSPQQASNRLREAAFHIRSGDSRTSEAILQEVSAVPPHQVVDLAFHAIGYITGDEAAADAQRNPQGEVANVGPFLLLVAARLLHGGVCRDFSMYWSSRLGELRSVRQQLQEFVLRPAMRSSWLFPALNEISVAWAVLSKLLLLAHTNTAAPGAATEVPPTAVEFVRNEWLWMLNSALSAAAPAAHQQRPQQEHQLHPPEASLVFLSLLRQCIDECGLTARASLGRGLSLDRHDAVRECVFKNVMPQFLCAASEGLIALCIDAAQTVCSSRPQEQQHSAAKLRFVNKLQEIIMAVLSWGPSAFMQEYAADKIPGTLSWPARSFRPCLFAKTTKAATTPCGGIGNNNRGINGVFSSSSDLLLFDAAITAFRLGLCTTSINEIAQPAIQVLAQLCSVYMLPPAGESSAQLLQQQIESGEESEKWTEDEAARFFHEASSVLLGVCGFEVMNNFLPDPMSILDGDRSSRNNNNNSNNLNNDIDPEEAIEHGGTMIRQLAIACQRLTFNCLHRNILTHPNSIQCLPGGVIDPLREFTVNTIRFAHRLSLVVRCNTSSGSNSGDEAQIEEPFTEAIEPLLRTWRELLKTGIDDVDCNVKIAGSPLEACLTMGARTVFDTFVRSRVMFGRDLVEFQRARIASSGNNNINNFVGGGGGGGGLVSSCIAAHGMEYALEQINTVGLVGRNDARAACDLLSELLGSQAQEFLATIQQSAAAGGPACVTQSQTESVWYLFKLVAVVLSDDEVNVVDVPMPIINLVAAVEREALNAGAYNSGDPAFERELEQRIPVFALMRGTLHFAQQIMSSLSSSMANSGSHHQQPRAPARVVSALLALLRRFIWAYVDFDSSRTTEASNHRVFASAFDGGVGIAGPAVSFLSWSLCHYSDDDDTMKEAGMLLDALCGKEHIGPWFMCEQSRFGVVCAAAVGDTSVESGGPQRKLKGEQRGRLAGSVVSACASNAMKSTAMNFLDYYVRGFSDIVPPAPHNNSGAFDAVADTVESISAFLANAKNAHQLGALVGTIQPYLAAIVARVTNFQITPPHQQNHELLSGLLELFLNGIEVCSFNMPNEVIAFMLQSSVELIEVIGRVIRYSCEHILPRFSNNHEARQREEQAHLKMLKSAAALILCAAQWGNLYFPSFLISLGGGYSNNNQQQQQQLDSQQQQEQNKAAEDERERMVGTLCTSGLILVLRESRATDLIEARELSTIVFRVMKEIARQHTRYFLGASSEDAAIMLDATHWALQSADPELNEYGFAIIEAIAITPGAQNNMSVLLKNFLDACINAIVSGSAFEPSVQTALANALFALGVCLGVDALCASFMNAVGRTQLLAQEGEGHNNKYVAAFREAMSTDLILQQSRRNRKLFVPLLRRIVMTVRSASIFS